jgi:hypothetical protein
LDNPKHNIVKNIPQELDCGNDCYYNFKTSEILAIPDFLQIFDEEELKESLKKIEKHKADFIKIEVLESFDK